MRIALNIALFQLVWWTSVLTGARGIEWPGPAVALAAFGMHLALSADHKREAVLVLAAALGGYGVDAALTMLGVLSFRPHALGSLPPIWIAALWLGFATTINVTFSWFRGRAAASAALGLISGPLAYGAGEALGALELEGGWFGVLLLGSAWAALLACVFNVASPACRSKRAAQAALCDPQTAGRAGDDAPLLPLYGGGATNQSGGPVDHSMGPQLSSIADDISAGDPNTGGGGGADSGGDSGGDGAGGGDGGGD